MPVILDEFPYLSDGTDTLPSVIQNALSPRGAARRRSRDRLVLCGSAISVVRDLLRGSAPLRGRATTELVVHPFGFRDTAGLWGLTRAPEVALRVHALLGAPPAYRDMCGGDAPESAWAEVQDTVRSKIYGPHFEAVAREWCLTHAAPSTLGGSAGRVQPATLPCPAHRSDHELDVVVTTIAANAPDRVTAIGEATWHGEPVGVGQLERLEHIRTLLSSRRAPEPPRLLLFSLAGFAPDLSRAARGRADVELIALDRLYRGS